MRPRLRSLPQSAAVIDTWRPGPAGKPAQNDRWPSGCVGEPDPPRDFGAAFGVDDRDIVLALQVEPELRTIGEIASEANRGVGADRASTVKEVRYPAWRHAEIEREAARAQVLRIKLAFQQASRMCAGPPGRPSCQAALPRASALGRSSGNSVSILAKASSMACMRELCRRSSNRRTEFSGTPSSFANFSLDHCRLRIAS